MGVVKCRNRENVVDVRGCEIALQERIAYRFADPFVLRKALTHKSYANEALLEPLLFNERLEFLGDAVLDLVVSDILFRTYPDLPEGELTRIRSEVVSEKALASIAGEYKIGDCLLLGKGEERTGGRLKESLLANTFEALLGAIYCDGGLDGVRDFVNKSFVGRIDRSFRKKGEGDYKTTLQELLQGRFGGLPVYRLLSAEGPDHSKIYRVEVSYDGSVLGGGSGGTKKAAEQEAARGAIERLGE